MITTILIGLTLALYLLGMSVFNEYQDELEDADEKEGFERWSPTMRTGFNILWPLVAVVGLFTRGRDE